MADCCLNEGLSSKDKLLFKFNGTPSDTDLFLISGDSIDAKTTVASKEHNLVGSGQMNNKRTSYDKNNITAEFTAEMLVEGTGAKGTPPKISDFYKSSGHTETIDAGASVTYAPHFDKIEPSTAKIYKGGSQESIYTALISTMTISGTVGEALSIKFDLQGYGDMQKTAKTIADSIIEEFAEFSLDFVSAVTVSGTEICANSFELAQNADIKQSYHVQCKGVSRKDLSPALTLTALKAMNDPSAFVDFLNQTTKSVKITCSNGQGELLEIEAKKALPKPVEEGADDGSLTETRSYDCKNDANGVPYTIVYKVKSVGFGFISVSHHQKTAINISKKLEIT